MKAAKNSPTEKKTSHRRSALRRRRLRVEALEQRQLLAGDLLFADSFEVGTWNGQWVEDSQNDWYRSAQRSTDGSVSAEVDGKASNATLTMANPIALSGYGSAELSYSWLIEGSFDNGEYLAVDFYNGSWQEIDRLRGNSDAENTWHHETIAIDSSYLDDDFKIRFRASTSGSDEDANVDNVKIMGVPANSEPVGLVSHWTADNSAFDAVGSNHGTAVGGATYASGQMGQAFSFDGVDDRVLVADSPSLRLTKSMTIEGWIKADSIPVQGQQAEIFFRGDDRGGLDPYSLSLQADGRLRYEVAGLTDAASIWARMPIGEFVHMAATLDDASGAMRLYLDGELVSQTTTAVRPFANLDSGSNPGIGIGNHGGYPHSPHNFPFDGLIDDLKIYDVALSSTEVLANFYVGNGSQEPSILIDNVAVVEGGPGYDLTDAFVSAGDGELTSPFGMTFGPDGNLYVASNANDSVRRYDGTTGAFIDVFVASGAGGLDHPWDLEFHGGDLFVASALTNSVLRYNGSTGAFIDAFVTSGSGGLDNPRGLLFGTNNDLYVTSTGDDDAVLRYSATTGAFIDEFIASGDNGMNNPTEVAIGPDGYFYVSSTNSSSNSVLRYDSNGNFIDTFATFGSGGLDGPTDIAFDDGLVLIAGVRSDSILAYDQLTRGFVGTAVASGGGGLDGPRSMLLDSDGRLYVSSSTTSEVLRFGETASSVSTVSLSWPSPHVVTVTFETLDGSAVGGSDYQSATGTVAFAPGVTSQTIRIPILEDASIESDELFHIDLTSAVNASIVDHTGEVTITERRFSVDDVTANEGDSASHYRGPFVESPLRENFVSMGFGPDGSMYASSQSAGGAIDRYDGTTGELVDRFVAGGFIQGVRSPIFRNGFLYAGSEYTDQVLRFNGTTGAFVDVFVAAGAGGIDGPHGMTFGPDANADGVPELYVAGRNSANVVRYDGVTGQPIGSYISSGSGGLSYPEGLSFDPLHASLFVASSGSGALLKYDALTGAYQGVGANVPAGPKDIKFGADGLMYVASSGDDRVIRFTPGGVLVDDFVPSGLDGFDNPGRLAFGPNGDLFVSGSGIKEIARFGTDSEAVFTVTLSAPSSQVVTVDFTTSNATAFAGSDYSAVSGTLVFAPGTTSRTVLVPTLNDSDTESPETFLVILTNASGVGIEDGQGVATIIDDDSNAVPIAGDDAATTDSEVERVIDVLANDSDPDGDPLFVDSVGPTTGGGTVVINLDNTIRYTSAPGFSGTDTFDYTISDGRGGTATATVTIDVTEVVMDVVYVADIRFESRKGGKEWRAVYEIRDQNGVAVNGATISVRFHDRTYLNRTTDSNGQFRTGWLRLSRGSYEAEVTDLAFFDYTWDLTQGVADSDDEDSFPDALLRI